MSFNADHAQNDSLQLSWIRVAGFSCFLGSDRFPKARVFMAKYQESPGKMVMAGHQV